MPRHGEDQYKSMETDPLLASAQPAGGVVGGRTPKNGKSGKADEHALTPRQAMKAYPMAIFWTLAVSMTVIMEGVRIQKLSKDIYPQ